MKKFALASMLALAPLLSAQKANAWFGCGNGCGGGITLGGQISVSGFCKCYSCNPCSQFGPICGGGGCGYGCGYGGGYGYGGLAPWYTYYPYDAYFQTAAPTGYPYWPAPMTSYTAPAESANVGSYQYGGTYLPAGAAVPAYWYGK
jgi:hypothetical protein